jgi:DNA-directed RNA polymerase specialized sigma subunit
MEPDAHGASDDDLSHLARAFREGNMSARDRLIQHKRERLRRLARRILGEYPGLRGREETDDILQIAMRRLDRALDEVELHSSTHLLRLGDLQTRAYLTECRLH